MTEMLDEDFELPQPGLDQDRRAELGLGALVCLVVGVLVAMLAFILKEAWPSFAHNGCSWFLPGGNVDTQIQSIFTSGDLDQSAQLHDPRLAADLEHDPDHRRRGRDARSSARCSCRCSWSSSRRRR